MTSYNFPTLKQDDIVNFVQEIAPEFGFSENDLKTLQPVRIMYIYRMILEALFELKDEQLYQMPINEEIALPNRELYDESLPLVMFSCILNHIMNQIGMSDVSVRDLIEPRPKRTIRILSCLINFYRFFFSRIEVYESIKGEKESVRADYIKLTKSNDSLRSQINAIKAASAEQEFEAEQIQSHIDKVMQRISDHYKTQTAKQTAISEIKVKYTEAVNQAEQLKLTISKEQEKNDRLAGQIVQSPERMKSEVERMKNQVVASRESKEKAILRLHELKEQDTGLTADVELDPIITLLNNISTETEQEKNLQRKLSSLDDKIQVQRDVLHDKNVKLEQARRITSSKQEKLSKMNLQNQVRITSGKENIHKLKQEFESYHQARSEDEIVKSSLETEKQQQLKILNAKKSQIEEQLSTYKLMYSQILEQVDYYHGNLAAAWENVSGKMEELNETLPFVQSQNL